MILYPNAKINIGLNIVEKRTDGYHEISSVFYPVKTLFDILEIIPSDVFSFASSGLPIPEGPNICIKAYKLLERDFDIDRVNIHLHKQIPIGAGLGGGSADGTFTLIALNLLFKLGLSDFQLKEYALQLGADCPFFVENTPKYVTGIGEKMLPIDLDLSSYEMRFIFPKIHMSTAQAYDSIVPIKPKKNLLELISQPVDYWKLSVKNDFEPFAFRCHQELKDLKEKLYLDAAVYASMSGSGSALYGLFER